MSSLERPCGFPHFGCHVGIEFSPTLGLSPQEILAVFSFTKTTNTQGFRPFLMLTRLVRQEGKD